ncbi:molecular chaperone GrpE [Pseudoxanthobacter soli DSM 19599]|uniref:Protein GrpE n=1 Tax=Pseudoxanthobacter soli DSM 19599 TaxID=1123029 RepID=A0A1M7ZMG2_9HYPH|nr:nucleotide exchange factor GrpE [Pseudoxanthobacter soli]SHO66094.1 molecular chaperone GrpE [Pseudoxanthobacter soli DSM 19599]
MTTESREPTQETEPAAEAVGSEDAQQPQAAASDAVAALKAENDNLRDQVLRTLAEMENLRRRTEREVQDAGRYAIASFARDMLSVGDNLRRALDALPAEARAAADSALTNLLSGVELTERELLKGLEKHGVRKIAPSGQKFDPNLHQAMFEVPNAEVPNGTVVQVLQEGFVIGDRVLRPALVGVSKGGPKSTAKAADETAG